MLKIIAVPLALSIGLMLTAFGPAPAGYTEATVPDVSYVPKMLSSCLAGVEHVRRARSLSAWSADRMVAA